MSFGSVFEILSNDFEELKSRNPSFSLRAYSKRLGVDSGALSQILNGKRNLSENMAQRLMDGLGLDPKQQRKLLAKKISGQSLQLSSDQYQLISQWQHFAILALMGSKDFESSEEFVARRLKLTMREARGSLKRLERLGLINTKVHPWSIYYDAVQAPDEVTSQALRTAHRNNLKLAEKSLDEYSLMERDFFSITVSANPKQIKKVKNRIREFAQEISEIFEKGPKTEVYKFCSQLIPLSNLGDQHD